MSIKIEIGLGDEYVSATALDAHMAALGFSRQRVVGAAPELGMGYGSQQAVSLT